MNTPTTPEQSGAASGPATGSPALPKTRDEWMRAIAGGCALELAGGPKDFKTVSDTVLRYMRLFAQENSD